MSCCALLRCTSEGGRSESHIHVLQPASTRTWGSFLRAQEILIQLLLAAVPVSVTIYTDAHSSTYVHKGILSATIFGGHCRRELYTTPFLFYLLKVCFMPKTYKHKS